MKTRLHLGLAFRDSRGLLRVSLQLIPIGENTAIGSADFIFGVCDRFLLPSRHHKLAAQFRVEASECAQETTVKSFDWCYPSSPNAEAFGFGKTGCWCIELGQPGKPLHAVRAFPAEQKDYGVSCAQSLPFAWLPAYAQLHPEHATHGN